MKNVREAMLADREPGAAMPKLLVYETLVKSSSSRLVRAMSVQLLAMSDATTRTEGDMIALVEKSGFKFERIHHMRAIASILEATPVI